MSHLGRSLGSGAWRTGNKNSPFGCCFSSFALGDYCFSSQLLPAPVCSLAPLAFRGARTEHYPFSLNILSKLASSSPAKSLGRRLIAISCLGSFRGRQGGCCGQSSGPERREAGVVRGAHHLVLEPKTTQHCSWTPATGADGVGRSLKKVRGQTPQLGTLASRLPLHPPAPPLFLPKTVEGLCFLWIQSEDEISKSGPSESILESASVVLI